jgi:predicted NUDIX family NTP pyrophosphohydrolase
VKQKGGKLVRAWALEVDYDLSQVRSNTFTMEWPPKSGRASSFPEVDKADWLGINEARAKVNLAQVALLEETLKLAMSP